MEVSLVIVLLFVLYLLYTTFESVETTSSPSQDKTIVYSYDHYIPYTVNQVPLYQNYRPRDYYGRLPRRMRRHLRRHSPRRRLHRHLHRHHRK